MKKTGNDLLFKLSKSTYKIINKKKYKKLLSNNLKYICSPRILKYF